MLRAMFKAMFNESKSAPTRTRTNPNRFAPAVQPLEAREVPAVATFTVGDTVLIADSDNRDDTAVVSDEDASVAKVKFQDISITTKVPKSSPG